jgi:Protein of unknown function (DUF732)
MARPFIRMSLSIAVGAATLGLICSTPSLAAAKLNPKDAATCARLDVALHDSAEGLTTSITGAIRNLGNVGATADDAPLRRAVQSLRSATSSRNVTAALQSIGSSCTRLGDPPKVSESDQFVSTLRSVAPEVTLPDAEKFEGLAKTICADMRRGATVTNEVAIMKEKNLASDVASGVLGGSVVAYCHQFTSAVQQFMNAP